MNRCGWNESLYRLSALQSPPTSDGLSSSEALSFPSVQLFVESAAEAINEFVLSDEDARSSLRSAPSWMVTRSR